MQEVLLQKQKQKNVVSICIFKNMFIHSLQVVCREVMT